MQDQTPEMERINAQLREVMREWVRHPARKELKERYNALHRQYQRLLLQQKRQSLNGAA
jgi:uncharacterized Zn finger protein